MASSLPPESPPDQGPVPVDGFHRQPYAPDVNAKVVLEVVRGPQPCNAFEFTGHDTFLFGRAEDCHMRLPDDIQVSRHHFLLEVCAPRASLTDLGSLNGTMVNGSKRGGRKKSESPEQGARRKYPTVELADGDLVEVGKSALRIRLVKGEGGDALPAALPEGDLSRLSPEELFRLVFANLDNQGLPSLSIPHYRIERELGRGGYGAVYLASPVKGGTKVAVKVLLSRASAHRNAAEQFKREMQVVQELHHPNIVRFRSSGSSGGAFYFVMDYCDGGSLQDLAASSGGKIPPARLMPLVLQALEGLAYAHAKGVVHRDIKPANILLHAGQARISDFGLSKSFQRAGLSGMSLTGQYAGTPLFMPPEQITNFKYVQPVSDVWSMGATIYHVLTGKHPYSFDSNRDPFDVILNEPIVPIRKRMPQLDQGIAAVVDKCVAKSPSARYPSANEVLQHLGRIR